MRYYSGNIKNVLGFLALGFTAGFSGSILTVWVDKKLNISTGFARSTNQIEDALKVGVITSITTGAMVGFRDLGVYLYYIK